MAQPPEIDGQAVAQAAAWAKLLDELRAELAAIAGSHNSSSIATRRAIQALNATLRQALAAQQAWTAQAVPAAYGIGGEATASMIGGSFTWNAPTVESAQRLIATSWSDLLDATNFVTADTKRTLRALIADQSGRALLAGETTPEQAASKLTRSLLDRYENMLTVRYSNGARHSLAGYLDTALRTVTANAHNYGSLDVMRGAQITYCEMQDGPFCGLTAHNDSTLADGLVVPIEVGYEWPLSHPNCRRVILPRPDIVDPSRAKAATADNAPSPEALAAQQAETAAIDAQRAGRFTVAHQTRLHQQRQARTARQPRSPRTARQPRG